MLFQNERQNVDGCSYPLANYCCQDCAKHAHLENYDEKCIQCDVCQCANKLGNHWDFHVACCLQKASAHDIQNDADTTAKVDCEVHCAVLDDDGVTILNEQLYKWFGKCQTYDKDYNPSYKAHDKSRLCCFRCLFAVAFAKFACDVGICTNTNTDCNGSYKHCDGKNYANSGKRFVADVVGEEQTVYDVIERLYQHGKDCWQTHRNEQLANAGVAHFV